MSSNTPFGDSSAAPREILQRLLGEALSSPDTFGTIRLFRFEPLADTMLIAVPAATHSRGVLAFYLGDKRSATDSKAAKQALTRFIPQYLRALSAPIEDPQFVEVAAEDVQTEIAKAHSQLAELPAEVLMFAFEAKPIRAQSKSASAEPSRASKTSAESFDVSAAADDAFDNKYLSEAMFAFAERVVTPGSWDTRPKPPIYALAEKQPVFSLIASNVLADFLPLRDTDYRVRWDDLGVEVYGLPGTNVTLVVLYTGDPTGVFAAIHLPEALSEEEGFELVEAAYSFAIDCGLVIGRPRPPEDAEFVRITDPNEIRARLKAGLDAPTSTFDLLAADCPEARPTNLSFGTLAAWMLGQPPDALRLKATGYAPAISKAKVFRHPEFPLATVVAVVHSEHAAINIAVFFPLDMPPDAWPEIVSEETGPDYRGPEYFERLVGEEADRQLRRVLVALEAEGGVSESYNVFGEPTPEVQEGLTQAVSWERAEEFKEELLSFAELVQTWAQREEEQVTRPPSFIARHEEDPHLLLLGAISEDGDGIRTYLIADVDTELDPFEIIDRLGNPSTDGTLEEVLDAAGFEILGAEEARDELMCAVERLSEKEAELYDIEPADTIH